MIVNSTLHELLRIKKVSELNGLCCLIIHASKGSLTKLPYMNCSWMTSTY